MKTQLQNPIAALFLSGLLCIISGCAEVDSCVENTGNESENVLETRTDKERPYYFYDHENNKIFLSLDTGYAFLSVNKAEVPSGIANLGAKASEFQSDEILKKQNKTTTDRFYTELSFGEKLSDEQYLELLSEIRRTNRDVIVAPYFNDEYGNKIGLSNLFYVKLKSGRDIGLLEKTAAQLGCIVVDRYESDPLWVTLSVTGASELNALECALFFHESDLFAVGEPDLMAEMQLYSNDDFFDYQYYLKNIQTMGVDINVEPAWGISTGSGITVAVFDTGIDLNHDDLAANIHRYSYDAKRGSVPQQIYLGGGHSHGTMVAGIVGAEKDNGDGIAGVAPDCNIMAISHDMLLPSSGIRQQIATGIDKAWQNGADVINCSWGHQTAYNGSYITDAINRATTQGRGGKGSVVVVATGNEGNSSISYPASLPNVIAVGAVNQYGTAQPYSNKGNELDVVAPSGILNMAGDVHTTDAYNSYVPDFGGTSAAAPQVAGIAALILSVDYSLTQQMVRDIITRTASNNNSWNSQTGYGVVDAHAAVIEAISWRLNSLTIGGDSEVWNQANATYSLYPNLPAGVTFSGWTISPGSGYTVTGGTSYPGLNIKFQTQGQYTLTARYSYNGVGYTRTKVVTSHRIDVPILTWEHDDLTSTSGWDARVRMINWQSTVNYEWRANNSSAMSTPDPWFYVTGSSPNDTFTVRCRARIGMAITDWSNPVVVTAP